MMLNKLSRFSRTFSQRNFSTSFGRNSIRSRFNLKSSVTQRSKSFNKGLLFASAVGIFGSVVTYQSVSCEEKQPSWTELPSFPNPRSSHTVVATNGRVYVLGGEDSPRHTFDSHLYSFNPDTQQWRKEPRRGDVPPPTLGLSSCAVGDKLYFFGGRLEGTMGDGDLNTLYEYDTFTQRWTNLSDITKDVSARSFHTMTSVGDRIYVFAGCGDHCRYNDIVQIDIKGGRIIPLPSNGDVPIGRGGSTLVGMENLAGTGDRLYMIYGFIGKQTGDVKVYDTIQQKWLSPGQDDIPQISGDIPSDRSVMGAVPLSGRRILIFGGESEASDLGHEGAGEFTADTYTLQVDSMTWKQVETQISPEARGWFPLAHISDDVYLFGGLARDNSRFGDFWVLSV